MGAVAYAGILKTMTAGGQPTRLGLEVRFDAEPIEGRVYDREDGDRLDRAFSGWLGLMAAIDAARCASSLQGEKGEA